MYQLAPYRFQQPPDACLVERLADAHRGADLFGTLGTALRDTRRRISKSREFLRAASGEHSVALLRDILRASTHAQEIEAALRMLYDGAYVSRQVRCESCHRRAPASESRVLLHYAGSMLCSGSGDKARP
jgi:hypothetical protein